MAPHFFLYSINAASAPRSPKRTTMKSKAVILLSLLFTLFGGCTEEKDEIKYGSIAGVVYDESVGEPIPIVKLELTPSGKTAVTGLDGSFNFVNIKTGDYTIKADKKGYESSSNVVSVVDGISSECNLTLKRIPAYVTADKEELDFGENLTFNTQSFNIVNSSYEDLSWHIDFDSTSFVKSVTPLKGTTLYGKTATIVVKIDRDKLQPGNNVSALVIISDNGDGSSEVKIKAIGKEKNLPALNIFDVTDLNESSAILNGEIINSGIPSYTERGFVISDHEMPEVGTALFKITATISEDSKFSARVTGLTLGQTYYVRAYAINSIGTAYSSNQISFTVPTELPTLDVYDATNVSGTSAILNGEIMFAGIPKYTERGFVFGDKEMPDISTAQSKLPVTVTEETKYSIRVNGLTLGKTYYVRTYAINQIGTAYSSNQISFTVPAELPSLNVFDATDISESSAILNGEITNDGIPTYTERGFVISEQEMPEIETALSKLTATVTSDSKFSVRANGLKLGQKYYVRAYAINSIGTAYSSNQISFTTLAELPVLNVNNTTNISSSSAILNGEITNDGIPTYTERGFVISDKEMPEIGTALSKLTATNNNNAKFSVRVDGLTLGNTYYVRAYAINSIGTAYSTNQDVFVTTATLPTVSTLKAANEDRETHSIILKGTVSYIGDPAYTEKGFVWSTDFENPTIEDSVIVIEGTEIGDYEKRITFSNIEECIYYRAYAKNAKGVAYGTSMKIFDPPYIIIKSLGLAVQKEDIGYGNWYDVKRLCQNSRVGGYSDWRLPSYNELVQLYNIKDQIGNFNSNGIYYSSSYRSESYFVQTGQYSWQGSTYYRYYYSGVNFRNGSKYESNAYDTQYNNESWTGSCYARAVRSLSQQ